MTVRAERAEEAAALRAQGLLYREIAERMGVSLSLVQDLVTDPAGDKVRLRKLKRSRPCLDCGTLVTKAGSEPPERCRPCRTKFEKTTEYRLTKRQSRATRWSDAQIFAFLRRFPTTPAYLEAYSKAQKGWMPSRPIIIKRFGSWNGALTAAGLELNQRGTRWGITRDGARLAVQDCQEALQLQRPPTYGEYEAWARSTGAPSACHVRKIWGTWRDLIASLIADEEAVAA